MASISIKFPRDDRGEFYSELRKRVGSYFKDNGISRYGDYRMIIKTIAMISIYVVSYLLILSRVTDSFWLNLLLWMVLGLGVAGIGLSIMHDASHGAFSKNKKVNKIFGDIMVFIGGSEYIWNIQHNHFTLGSMIIINVSYPF